MSSFKVNKRCFLRNFNKSFLYTLIARVAHFLLLKIYLFIFSVRNNKLRDGSSCENLIVSLTSYPARINNVWMTVESIFNQSLKPCRIVLVLSELEFPEKKLPKKIEEQVSRGLEIAWTEDNIKSYKKLIPVKDKYPDSTIVTFDDDVIYERNRLRDLVNAANKNPGFVVGARGKEVSTVGDSFCPYVSWPMAGKDSDPYRVVLTGVGGILYPPGLIDVKLLCDMTLAQEICPTADDLWFWFSEVWSSVPVKCLGLNKNMSVRFRDKSAALTTLNVDEGGNDRQLKKLQERFDVLLLLDQKMNK